MTSLLLRGRLCLAALAFAFALSPARAGSPTMIGVNIAGGDFSGSGAYPGTLGTDYWYPRQNDIDMAKAIGAELIRVPFKWDRIQRDTEGVLPNALWAPDIAALDASIAAMEARGMRIILEMHNYHKRSLTVGGVRTSYVVGSPQLPASEFAKVWRLLADHYKDRPSIWGYDLMNEPMGMTTADLVTHYQEAVNAIREVDMKTAIILEGGPNWNHASSWPTTGAPLIAVQDPANNLIFSAHCYTDRDQSGTWSHGVTVEAELVGSGKPYATLEAALNVGVNRVKPFVDWCVANNVRGLVGEYASPYRTDEANWNIVTQRMLDYMVVNGNGLISGTQWSAGGISLNSQTRMLPRVDNSIPTLQETVLPDYVSGVGTNYWQNFTWYNDAITSTADYAFAYVYPNTSVTIDVNDASGPQSGTKAIKVAYNLPSGSFGGGGLHTRGPLTVGGLGGVDIRRNVQANHVLSFYAKGTPGASISVTLGKTTNASGVDGGSDTGTGNWVALNAIAPLSNTWQLYEIPLSAIINAQVTGNERVQRFRFTLGPTDGVAREVFFDRILITRPSTNTPPLVSVDTATGGTTFAAGQNVALVASASDANPGDSIDYVEFYANGHKVGIDDSAPYQCTTSFTTAGTYDLRAIAFDSHGTPARSAAKLITVTANPPTTVSLTSMHGFDGWVLESTATSSVGGSFAAGKIRVGDDGSNRQYVGILSFDTSSLPDSAVITGATLQVKRDVVQGTDPFTTHGTCRVDVRTGGFNGNTALEAADLQAAPTAANVATMSQPAANGSNSTGTLNAAGLGAINKTGVTQFRLAFTAGDDGDSSADYLQCNQANDGAIAKRPTLIVTYQ
jgi:hypothetical protein